MAFFKLKKTEAEKEQARMLKELARVAKATRQHAAKERKQHQKQAKQQQKQAKRLEKQLQQQAKEQKKSQRQAARVAKKASKTRIRLVRKAEKERARRQRRQQRQAVPGTVAAPPFSKSAGCFVCGAKFGQAKRRHHCRQCRESCCLQCTSRTRRAVPRYGLAKPQKVCVVCETLVFNAELAETPRPREPAEAVAALAASGRARCAQSSRRPHSAPLPRTEGVAVMLPSSARQPARSSGGKGPSFWSLPIRPLLKRKKSADQLRNRKMDQDLLVEKRMLFGGHAIELQPQAA